MKPQTRHEIGHNGTEWFLKVTDVDTNEYNYWLFKWEGLAIAFSRELQLWDNR